MYLNIENYMSDGAGWQEQVVMMILKGRINEVTDSTFNSEHHRNDAEIVIGRYENCREQGYVFSLKYKYNQLAHYCVFQHRNSDSICIIKFKGDFINTPTIDDIWKDRKDKYDYDKSFEYKHFNEVVDWLIEDMSKEISDYREKNRK